VREADARISDHLKRRDAINDSIARKDREKGEGVEAPLCNGRAENGRSLIQESGASKGKRAHRTVAVASAKPTRVIDGEINAVGTSILSMEPAKTAAAHERRSTRLIRDPCISK